MRAIVTGSAGFIGGHLVEELVGRGYRVTAIDRQSPTAGLAQHVVLDLADDPHGSGLTEAVSRADVVFHLAAVPGVRGSGPAVEQSRRLNNVIATMNLLSVVPLPVPVVATSSSSVYGWLSAGHASREGDPLRPRGGYARSKQTMERVCEQRRARGGVVAVMRPFTVAGEGQRPDMAFSTWLRALEAGEPIRILGSGDRTRDVTDVAHVVEGLIRAAEHGVNEAVNLGTGVSHRLIDMATTMLDLTGIDAEIVYQPVGVEEVDATRADTTRCRDLLSFVPETDLRSLLTRQIAAAAPLAGVAG
ncbi:MAG: NAD-dependent epimerase/dehydratase family protein [Acidimicrobiia bacterium]